MGGDRLGRPATSRDGARGRGDGGAAGLDERPGHLQRCVQLRVGSRRRALVVCGILELAARCAQMRFPAIGCSRFAGRCSPRSCLGPCRPVSRLLGRPLARSHALLLHYLTSLALQPLWGCCLPHDRRQYIGGSRSVHLCRLGTLLQTALPSHSQFPPRHLMPHSASPKSKQPACPKCLKLGYEACMQCGMRGLGVGPDWRIPSLWARSYHQLSSLATLRERCVPSLSPSPCLWPADHVSSHAGAPPPATVPSAAAFVSCASVVPRAGVAALVALMFRRTRARPSCFMWSHVWAQIP